MPCKIIVKILEGSRPDYDVGLEFRIEESLGESLTKGVVYFIREMHTLRRMV